MWPGSSYPTTNHPLQHQPARWYGLSMKKGHDWLGEGPVSSWETAEEGLSYEHQPPLLEAGRSVSAPKGMWNLSWVSRRLSQALESECNWKGWPKVIPLWDSMGLILCCSLIVSCALVLSFYRNSERLSASITFNRRTWWELIDNACLVGLMPKKPFKRSFIFFFSNYLFISNSVQFSSVAQSGPTLCNPINCSTPGLPAHHQLPQLTQTHVHRVGDAIQPSHPLSSPSPPALSLSQHQGLFQSVSSSHQVAKVLEFQLQHQSFQCTPGLISPRMDWLDLLAVQGILESPPTSQFNSINSLALSFLYSPTHIHTWLLEKP